MKKCPKEGCGQPHENPGRFCSRKCANSRVFSTEANRKKSESNKKTWQNPENRQARREKQVKYWQDVHAGVRTREGGDIGLKRVISQVESGTYLKYTEQAIRVKVRKYLLHLHGHKCSICNTEKWRDKPVPLVCDHIDGDASNNALVNFRLICLNCGGLLPTYVGRNQGKGRSKNR